MNQTSSDNRSPQDDPAGGDAPLRDDENSPYRRAPEDERTPPGEPTSQDGQTPSDGRTLPGDRPPDGRTSPSDEGAGGGQSESPTQAGPPDVSCTCGSECGLCGAGEPGRGGHALGGWRLVLAAAVMFIEPLIFAIVGAIVAGRLGFPPSAGAIIGLLAGVVTAAVEVRLVVRKSAGGDGEDEQS